MKFLAIYTPDRKNAGGPPSPAHMAAMSKLVEEQTKAGVLVATGGLLPISLGGARIRSSGGKIAVVDGPFTESKELAAGFAILQTESKEAAIAAVERFLAIAGDGESELRQLMEPGMEPAEL
jgi:hypothetical protein